MITALRGEELAQRIGEILPSAVQERGNTEVWVSPESVLDICQHFAKTPGLEFDMLNSISAVDYVDHFELVYHLTSTINMLSAVVKTKVYGRENPSLPSVMSVWQGADFQEREIWDLMGVAFEGHPNLKRIMLWEGYEGHPLRKDYMEPPR